jgi:hypothetical protein
VVVGTTLVINSDTPSVGTDPCRTIWNIYAVNIDGSHTNGPIILSRNTKLSLQGFILAPNGMLYSITLHTLTIKSPSNCNDAF